MKNLKILLSLAFVLIGMIGYSQDVEIKNMINTKYNITAVYTDGSTNKQLTPSLNVVGTSGSIVTLPKLYPNYPDFVLSHWKIYATDCTPVLDAQHTYGTSDTDYITHCHQCANNAISNYNATGNLHHDLIGCR